MCIYPEERTLTWIFTSENDFAFSARQKEHRTKREKEVLVLLQKSTVADFDRRKERMTVAMRRKNYVICIKKAEQF